MGFRVFLAHAPRIILSLGHVKCICRKICLAGIIYDTIAERVGMTPSSIQQAKDKLANPKNVKFAELLKICREHFGDPRIKGSHHIFKTPWPGDPRINLQADGKDAKPYQVRQVLQAIEKLEGMKNG